MEDNNKERDTSRDLNDEEIELEIEEASDARVEDKLKTMRAKLKACTEEKMEALENLQRTKADFLNSKRRLEEQLVRDRERIAHDFIESLLPLVDSFDMAMGDSSWQECDEKWRKGVEGIYGQLYSILRAHNVTTIEEAGIPFDPHIHDAVSHDGEGEMVTNIMQKGYRVGESIIRPARVTVGSDT